MNVILWKRRMCSVSYFWKRLASAELVHLATLRKRLVYKGKLSWLFTWGTSIHRVGLHRPSKEGIRMWVWWKRKLDIGENTDTTNLIWCYSLFYWCFYLMVIAYPHLGSPRDTDVILSSPFPVLSGDASISSWMKLFCTGWNTYTVLPWKEDLTGK